MTTTDAEWTDLLAKVDEATKMLQQSQVVPHEVTDLVESLPMRLHAETPMVVHGDPYLARNLFAAGLLAQKALRHDDEQERRRDVRGSLEQFRQALRDLVSNRPVDADAPVQSVLKFMVSVITTPQSDVAELLAISTRQLQRWLSDSGSQPTGDDEARIRIVGQLTNQLRHSFTGPGVLAWFTREHPALGERPADLLRDPLRYPDLVKAATAARAMVG